MVTATEWKAKTFNLKKNDVNRESVEERKVTLQNLNLLRTD